MEIQHFSHNHPLVFIEGVGENEVIVCRGCDEPISDAAYKCSQYCSFFLHKSCTELQREIQHPVHSNHPLVLIALESRLCDCCRKSSRRCFVYHCKECDFDLDIKCASNWQSSAEDGHRHVFAPILKQIQFTCDICGEDRKGYPRVCSICQLLVDGDCAQLACTVEIGAHKDHFLTLIYSLHHQVKEQDDQVLCQLCYKTVNTKYGAYYCKICDFVTHLQCAEMNSLQQFDNLDASVYPQYLSMDLVDSATNVTKEISPGKDEGTQDILEEHPFVGEHNFILSDKKLEDDKFCEVCMQLISGSFYSCATCGGKCNIFIHDRCRNLPIKKQHLLHRHPLTLSLANKYIGDIFYCSVCDHLRHGFQYRCDECDYDLDIHCSSIPNIIKHEGHQHSLRLAIRPFDEICKGCDSRTNANGAFVCIDQSKCNFALCFRCAILPLVVKYEYDRHGLLKLTYSVEDDSGEYYCFICEKERNPKQWFYYCGECDFAAHPKCILGKYPYFKYGFKFLHRSHQHLLTFVQKTQFSPPCDICNEAFEDFTSSLERRLLAARANSGRFKTLDCRSTGSSSRLLKNEDRSSGDIGRSSEIRQSRTLDARSTPRSSEHRILTDFRFSAVGPYKRPFFTLGPRFLTGEHSLGEKNIARGIQIICFGDGIPIYCTYVGFIHEHGREKGVESFS